MYREGPEGTPFHTLLVEGYVDGPADVCKHNKFVQIIFLSLEKYFVRTSLEWIILRSY